MYALTLLTLLSAAVAAPAPLGIHPARSVATGTPTAPVGKHFQQFGFLILENTDFATAQSNPTFQSVVALKNNRLLSNYNGISHPSLPNYISSIAGTTFGVSDDGPPSQYNFPATDTTVLDLLEKKGLSWKLYAENYPGGCNTEATNGVAHQYAAKHNPPMYFTAITRNATRCAHVVPATQFATDLAAGTLPNWWYYVPNLNNDGHDTGISGAAAYVKTTWLPRFRSAAFTKGLAMVMTFDENEGSSPNHVWAALIGDALAAGGKSDAAAYSHYSLISTVEDNWGLGSLGRGDVGAAVIKV